MEKLARDISERAHAGQYRRDRVTPYFKHPENVANILFEQSESVIATAYLHDTLEDTDETEETLRLAGISEEVIEAVKILTKTKDVSYVDYLSKVNENEIARKVKIVDMISNLSDNPSPRQIDKYAKGLAFLLPALIK
jgi:(p)ppGpp synthase/HD superfamily hydrolase